MIIVRNIVVAGVLLLAILLTVPCSFAQDTHETGSSLPSDYTGFYYPSGIATDSSGNIYVTDAFADSIWKFSPSGKVITHWGSSGAGNGQFNIPGKIASGSDGSLYITDINNNRVQKFSSEGTWISLWNFRADGWLQCSPRPLADPYDQCWEKIRLAGIAAGPDGNLYIIDGGKSSILKTSPEGKILAEWGSRGSAAGQFDKPHDISVDTEGNVLVTDGNNNRIQKFSSGGTFLASFGSIGTTRGKFDSPGGICVDRKGSVYVTEFYQDRVQKFTPSGTFVTSWGTRGSGDGEFQGPADIAADSDGNIYVTDFGNHRVQKFTSDGSFLLKWGGSPAPTPEPTPRFECMDPWETSFNLTDHLARVNKGQYWGFSDEEIRQGSEKMLKSLDKKYIITGNEVHVCYSGFSKDLRDTMGITEEQRIALMYYMQKGMADGFFIGERTGYVPKETPHFVISGRVTDPDGRPVPDAVVRFESSLFFNTSSQDQLVESARLTSTTRSAADGTYHLNIVWGTVQNASVTKAGYIPRVQPGILLTNESATLDFLMAPETGPAPATSGFLVIPAFAALAVVWLSAAGKRKEK